MQLFHAFSADSKRLGEHLGLLTLPQFDVFSLNSLGVTYLALINTLGQTALWGIL